MKTNSLDKLNRIYDKYDKYFTTYFGRNSYEDSTRHLESFMTLMVTMAIKSKGDMYKKFIKRYGEVFDQALSNDKDELEKLNKGQKGKQDKGNQEKPENQGKLEKSYVGKYKEVFIKNVNEFFKDGVIIHDSGLNSVQVERLNYLFDTVKGHLIEPDDKRDVYERYLGEINKIMNEKYDGEDFEEWTELEIYLNIFEIKDELNDILLEMDDLTAEDVGKIMEGMEVDIMRVLDDLIDSDDSLDDFEPLSPTKDEDPDNEPVTELISEEDEEESNIDDFEGFEGLGDDEVNLEINIDKSENETNSKDSNGSNSEKDTDSDDSDDSDDFEVKEVTKKKQPEKKSEKVEKQQPKVEPKEEQEDDFDGNDFEELEVEQEQEQEQESEEELVGTENGEENVLDSLTGKGTEEDIDEIDDIDEIEDSYSFEDTEFEEDEEDNVEFDEDLNDSQNFGEDDEENVTDLEGILGSNDSEKKKKKVVIADEEKSMDLDKYL